MQGLPGVRRRRLYHPHRHSNRGDGAAGASAATGMPDVVFRHDMVRGLRSNSAQFTQEHA